MSNAPAIIIKKIIKGGHGGHHGGAWKVAYADFVTAMMAFFLLMWLLNATSEEQKRGLSNYFGPAGDQLGAGGSGGILGGLSIETEGNFRETKASSPISTNSVANEASASEVDTDDNEGFQATPGSTQGADQANAASKKNQGGEPQADNPGAINSPNFEGIDTDQGSGFSKKEARNLMEEYEEQLFQEAANTLKKALQESPELKDVAENLIVDKTPEGLRIQIIDKDKFSMFPSGSAVMYPKTKEILKQVVKAVQKLPNKISISGHTDAKPYATQNGYTNWELSTDRANATRRALLESGLYSDRIQSVVGRADREPLLAEAPDSDQNRRLSIVLLKGPGGEAKGAQGQKTRGPGARALSPKESAKSAPPAPPTPQNIGIASKIP